MVQPLSLTPLKYRQWKIEAVCCVWSTKSARRRAGGRLYMVYFYCWLASPLTAECRLSSWSPPSRPHLLGWCSPAASSAGGTTPAVHTQQNTRTHFLVEPETQITWRRQPRHCTSPYWSTTPTPQRLAFAGRGPAAPSAGTSGPACAPGAGRRSTATPSLAGPSDTSSGQEERH